MVQEKVFRFNLCYNFAMSESSDGAYGKEGRNLGGLRYSGEGGPLPAVKRRGNLRGPGMTGSGLLDSQNGSDSASLVKPAISVDSTRNSESKVIRKLRFKKGTNLYYLTHDAETGEIIIPRTPAQEDELFADALEFDEELIINEQGLEEGKGRSGRSEVIKKVGVSRYGAFTVVDYQVPAENGELKTVQRLASLTNKRPASENEVRRFNKINH